MSGPARVGRPVPRRDRDNAFFWEGLEGERLLLQRCAACGVHRFPPLPACADCGSAEVAHVRASGQGELYSWIVVHRAFSEAFEADVPYTVGVVELDEGCRMLARIEIEERPRIGMRLAVDFRRRGAGAQTWTEACFRPVDADG
jgi:uncharacterized OB-fold protein